MSVKKKTFLMHCEWPLMLTACQKARTESWHRRQIKQKTAVNVMRRLEVFAKANTTFNEPIKSFFSKIILANNPFLEMIWVSL